MSSSMRRPVVFIPAVIAAVVTLILALTSPTLAADASSIDSHVRTNERPIALLLRQASAESPFFRLLIDRLNESDVVVYVKSDRELPTHVDGQLTFVGAAGGRRYVVVSLAWGRSELRSMATLGHELQHALEVAAHPDIVNRKSLAQAYERFGFEAGTTSRGRSYDTHAAIAAGDRVWTEVTGRAGVVAERATILETRP